MRKIKDVMVTYEDNTQEVWTGSGTVTQHSSIVMGDKPRDNKDVKFVQVSLLLGDETP